MKPKTKQYLIALGVGLLLVVIIVLSRGIFAESDIYNILVILNDAFFVSGMCLLGAGGLVFASDEGVFRMLSYSISLFFRIRKRDGQDRKHKDFYEYKKAKDEKKHSCAHLLLVGLGFLAVAFLLLIWI